MKETHEIEITVRVHDDEGERIFVMKGPMDWSIDIGQHAIPIYEPSEHRFFTLRVRLDRESEGRLESKTATVRED
jgi:hypothetical protein